MKALITEVRTAVIATVVLTVVCTGVYPLVVFGVAQGIFPEQANGSLIRRADGVVVGSRLIGQGFAGEAYFHSRPSAAGDGYDAANSGGSNLGPTSEKLRDAVRERARRYREVNGLPPEFPVPADAVTASGSGLDPHIRPANADLQVPRVARVRRLSEATVRSLVAKHTETPARGILGEARVRVLPLNLELDRLRAREAAASPPGPDHAAGAR